jgi:ATP-binding cassette subfamily B protein
MTHIPADLMAGPRVKDDPFAPFDPRVARRMMQHARPYRGLAFAAIATVVAFVATQLCFPSLIRSAVDALVGKQGSWPLTTVLVLFGITIVANAAAGYASDMTAARLAQRVIFDLRRAMFAHLQAMPMAFMDQVHVGRIMSRLQGDVNALQEFLETSIIAVGDLALLVGITVVLVMLDWHLALIAWTMLPALVLARSWWLPRARDAFARARDLSSTVNGALAENIAGVRVVIGARREPENLARFTRLAGANRSAQIRASFVAQAMTPVVDLLTGLAMAVVLLGGTWLMARGRLDVGVMIAFIFYVQRFFDPIRTVAQQYTVMQRANAAAHRIFEVLDVPVSLADAPDATDLGNGPPSIEFRGVSFGYRPGRAVLHELDLFIAPYETVALVGPTGSGKSSIAALVRRFYDATDGAVRVAGRDVRTVTQAALGGAIAMVLQDPYLFSGSVLDNIRYATAHATRADIETAARQVGADDFIRALPEGYDTILGSRGQPLSLGQRQLVSFARALVSDPKILILDEATASIDSQAEARIREAMRILMAGRTSIIIAHRLATVREADRIIVLRDGRIIEQGSPDDLLQAGGLYAELHRNNHASFDDAQAA